MYNKYLIRKGYYKNMKLDLIEIDIFLLHSLTCCNIWWKIFPADGVLSPSSQAHMLLAVNLCNPAFQFAKLSGF